MFERLWFETAAAAAGIGLRGPPGCMFRQVAFPRSHLVDSPPHALSQAHEGARVQGWEVVVVGRGGEQSRPVLNECLSNPLL